MPLEVTIRLTIPQAKAAWSLLTGVDGGCDSDSFYRTCKTGARRISKALKDINQF